MALPHFLGNLGGQAHARWSQLEFPWPDLVRSALNSPHQPLSQLLLGTIGQSTSPRLIEGRNGSCDGGHHPRR